MSLLFFLKPIYGPGSDLPIRVSPRALHLKDLGRKGVSVLIDGQERKFKDGDLVTVEELNLILLAIMMMEDD